MKNKKYKPLNGWVHLGGAVYENKEKKIRIHLLGLVWNLMTNEKILINNYPRSLQFDKYLKINGGNRKRALMAWSVNHG